VFQVTDAALDRIADALQQVSEDRPDDACFRIVPAEANKLTLGLDTPNPDDATYDHEGATVLVIAPDLLERCEGRTLDADPKGNLVLS